MTFKGWKSQASEAVLTSQDPTQKPVLNKTDLLSIKMAVSMEDERGRSLNGRFDDYNYLKRRRRPVYVKSSFNNKNSSRISNFMDIFLNQNFSNVSWSGYGGGAVGSNSFVGKNSDGMKSSHNSSSSDKDSVGRTTTSLNYHLSTSNSSSSNSVNSNTSDSAGLSSYTRKSTVVTLKRRKGRTRTELKSNQSSSEKSHRKPKLLKEITLLNRQNCLAKLLCGVQVAQPPTKSSSALNDYAYLVKAFFDRFSIRGIVTDVVDAAFAIEQDRLDVLDDDPEDDEEDEDDDEEDDESSDRKRKKGTENRGYAGAQFHKMRTPPYENYEPKYYEEYDRFKDEIEYETVVDDHVPDFMEPDILRKRRGRNTAYVESFIQRPECKGQNESNGTRENGVGKRAAPIDINRVRRRRGIKGDVKRGFMGFYNPRFDKTAYLNKRQLELETTKNHAEQLSIAEEIAARLRSPRQCRLLSWFGTNTNNNNNIPQPVQTAPQNGMTTTITTITNTGGMVGNMNGMSAMQNLPQPAASAAAGNGNMNMNNPGSQVVTVIQQSPVTAPTQATTTATTTQSTSAAASATAAKAAAAATSAAAAATSMLKDMGQKASNAMAEASSVASHIGSTICPFTIKELQELILKAQTAPFPHFLTTTRRPAQNYIPGLPLAQKKPSMLLPPTQNYHPPGLPLPQKKTQMSPPRTHKPGLPMGKKKPPKPPPPPPPPPPTRITTTTIATTTTLKTTKAPPPPSTTVAVIVSRNPPPPSSRLDPSTFAQMFSSFDQPAPPNPVPHFQHATPPSNYYEHVTPPSPHYVTPPSPHYHPHHHHDSLRDIPHFQHATPPPPAPYHHRPHHQQHQAYQHQPTPHPMYHPPSPPAPVYLHHNEPTHPPSSQYALNHHHHQNTRPTLPPPIFPPSPVVYPTSYMSHKPDGSSDPEQQTRRPDEVPNVGMVGDDDDDTEFEDEPYVTYESKNSPPAQEEEKKKVLKPTPKWMTTTTPMPEDDEIFSYNDPNPPSNYLYGKPQNQNQPSNPIPNYSYDKPQSQPSKSMPKYSYAKHQNKPVPNKVPSYSYAKPQQQPLQHRPVESQQVNPQNLQDSIETQNFIREFQQPPIVVDSDTVYRPGTGTGLVPYHQGSLNQKLSQQQPQAHTQAQRHPVNKFQKGNAKVQSKRPTPAKQKKRASSDSEEDSDEDNSEDSEASADDDDEEDDEEGSDEDGSSGSGESRANINRMKNQTPSKAPPPPPRAAASGSASVEASEEEEEEEEGSNEAEEKKDVDEEEEEEDEDSEEDDDGGSKRSYERSDYSKDRLGSPASSDQITKKKPIKTKKESHEGNAGGNSNGFFSNFISSLSSFTSYFNRDDKSKKSGQTDLNSLFQKRKLPIAKPTNKRMSKPPSYSTNAKYNQATNSQSEEDEEYEDSEEEESNERERRTSKMHQKIQKGASAISSLISSWIPQATSETTTKRAPVMLEELGNWAKKFIISKLKTQRQSFSQEDDSGEEDLRQNPVQMYKEALTRIFQRKRKGGSGFFSNFPASFRELNDDLIDTGLQEQSPKRKRQGKAMKTTATPRQAITSGPPAGSGV